MSAEEFNIALDRLRQRFVKCLADDRELLASQLTERPENRRPQGALIQITAHRLSGAAGTLGFTNLGAAASQLDQNISKAQPVDAIEPSVHDAMQELLAQIDRILQEMLPEDEQ
jgi:HPt (histidine-containing phosphotransfer) domain-containing protein